MVWNIELNHTEWFWCNVVNPTENHPQYYHRWVVWTIPKWDVYGIGFTTSTCGRPSSIPSEPSPSAAASTCWWSRDCSDTASATIIASGFTSTKLDLPITTWIFGGFELCSKKNGLKMIETAHLILDWVSLGECFEDNHSILLYHCFGVCLECLDDKNRGSDSYHFTTTSTTHDVSENSCQMSDACG